MRTVDGNAFVVAQARDLQVLIRYGKRGAGIFPACGRGHRDRYHTGAAMPIETIGTVVGDGDLANAVGRIVSYVGIADGAGRRGLYVLAIHLATSKAGRRFNGGIHIVGDAVHIGRYGALVIRVRGYLGRGSVGVLV